jgi:hypothetical protein
MCAPWRRAFFDARPVGFQPCGDRLRVALPGDALRLLWGEPPIPQPGAEIPRMESDAEFLLNPLAESGRRPEFGVEAMVGRGLGQPAEGDLLLEVGQLGRAARDGPGE